MKVTQSCPTLRPHILYSPWNAPGLNTGVGSLPLLQRIFPTQRLNPDLPHCRRILYQLSHKGSPRILGWVAYPYSSRSSQPRNQTRISCTAGRFFTNWAIREENRRIHLQIACLLWYLYLDYTKNFYVGELSIASGVLSADGWWVCVILSCWWFGWRCSNTLGCWAGPGLGAKRPPGELTPIGIPWGLCHQWLCSHREPQQPPPPQETLHNPQVGPAEAPVEALLCAGSQCTWNRRVPSRTEVSVFPRPVEILHSSLAGFQSRYPGGCSSRCQTLRLGSLTWCSKLSLCGKPLRYNYFLVSGSPTSGYGIYVAKAPLLPSRCGLLLVFESRLSLLVGSSPFMLAVFGSLLWFWCFCEKRGQVRLLLCVVWNRGGGCLLPVSSVRAGPRFLVPGVQVWWPLLVPGIAGEWQCPLAGLSAVAVAWACLWSPQWCWRHTPTPRACVTIVLLPRNRHGVGSSYGFSASLLGCPPPTTVPCLSVRPWLLLREASLATMLPLQAVPMQPTLGLSLGLSPKPELLHPVSTWTDRWTSQTEEHGLEVPAFWAGHSSGCCRLDGFFHRQWGDLPGHRNLSSSIHSSLPRVQGPSWFHSLAFSFCLVMWRFSCPFRRLRSSASVQ